MVIRYHRAWGPVMLGLAALNFVVYAINGTWLQLALGVAMGLLGVLYIVRPFIIIEGTSLKVKNLAGLTMRSFTLDSFEDLEVERDAITITRAGQRERLKISRMMTSGGDLDRLAAAVREARARKAAPASEA